MHMILAGTTSTGNSGSSERGGRKPAVPHPETMTMFRLALKAMEATHHKGNN